MIRTTGTIRTTTVLLIAALVLGAAATAGAEVAPRLADLESRTSSPYEFDQVSKHCSTSAASRYTGLAYSGSASLRVHTQNDSSCEGPYARGIFQANDTRHLVAEDDFWFGAAIYLPSGFYAAHNRYTDLLRVDSYVYDDSSSVPYADRAEINFASWSNDSLYVRAARSGTERTLIGPISPSVLPEGTWSWVEIHVKLSAVDGTAYTELKIDGRSIETSRTANMFAGAAPLNRLRYGIVSTDAEGSGNLTAYFDRASLSEGERGPLGQSPPPAEEPSAEEPSPNPANFSLWRLDETGGTIAADATGASPGVYVNGPTRGASPISATKTGTAVAFDGVEGYVEVAPTPTLSPTESLTVEAWCKSDAFSGSLVQRFEAYELRPQPNGNLIWRVWVEGTMQTLTSGPGAVSTGTAHQLVGTYDGAKMRLYLDGVQVAARNLSGPLTQGTSYPLYIARNGHIDTYLYGIVDDVAVYSEALDAATVLDHYQRGVLLDPS